MCLIAWNWQPASDTPLLLVANRDEYFARPARPLTWWDDAAILAGRDLQAGGTWLGLSASGRLAALTNYRDPSRFNASAPSRGALVTAFLSGGASAREYLEQVAGRADEYNPFNLLVFDGTSLLGLESRHARIVAPEPGLGAVSNADFETPWPKLTALKSGFQSLLERGEANEASLLNLLQNPQVASDEALPATGVSQQLERALSPIFVRTPGYGTRASSVVRVGRQELSFVEQRFDAGGPLGITRVHANTQRANPGGS